MFLLKQDWRAFCVCGLILSLLCMHECHMLSHQINREIFTFFDFWQEEGFAAKLISLEHFLFYRLVCTFQSGEFVCVAVTGLTWTNFISVHSVVLQLAKNWWNYIQTNKRLERMLFIVTKHNAVYCDKTQHANFQGKPLFQAVKQHLNNS